MFMYSELIKSVYESPNYSSRNGQRITKITIHHAAGIIGGEALAAIFANPRRAASCNYAIGKDGEIIGVVPEELRSWCSRSRWNDEQAITIEVSNCNGKPNWEISETVMNSLIKLCADICRRYCIVPYFTGDKDGSMTFHYMFDATECPGRYIRNNINNIIMRINNELCLIPSKPEEPKEDSSYLVKVNCACLNIREKPDVKSKKVGEITDRGTYTIVETNGNWGKLKSGAGWISLKYVKRK